MYIYMLMNGWLAREREEDTECYLIKTLKI